MKRFITQKGLQNVNKAKEIPSLIKKKVFPWCGGKDSRYKVCAGYVKTEYLLVRPLIDL